MSLDPVAEYAQIRDKYPPLGRLKIAIFLLVVAVLVTASQFRHVNWAPWVGAALGSLGWEATKFRLRRNAREFAEAAAPEL